MKFLSASLTSGEGSSLLSAEVRGLRRCLVSTDTAGVMAAVLGKADSLDSTSSSDTPRVEEECLLFTAWWDYLVVSADTAEFERATCLYPSVLFVVSSLSRVWLFCDPMYSSLPSYLSMAFSRQEYWNGVPFPPQGGLPNSGIQPESLALAGGLLTTEPPERPISWWGWTIQFPPFRLCWRW